MAKNTVEYISSALGSGIISNAASEATLQELLVALSSIEGESDSIDDTIDSINATSKILKSSNKLFHALGKGLGHTVSAGTNFAKMIANGENRLSAYGRFLQEDVIKKLPIVGEALSGFSGILVSGIETLESWNDDLRRANQAGATFGHSLLEFKMSATAMGLSNDELVSLISSSSDKIVSFGMGTVSDGIRRLTKFSEAMFLDSDYVSNELDRMGYSSYQQNELLIDYIYLTRRGKALQGQNYSVTGEEFLSYAKNLDALTKLTGKSRDERMKAAGAASNDISYQVKMAKLLPAQQQRMELALNGFAMLFGEQGAELFKARALNVTTMNDVAFALQRALGPDFDKALSEVQKLARTAASDQEFEKALNNILGDQLQNAQNALKILEPVLKGAVSGNEESKRQVKALQPVIGYLLKQGEMSDDVKNNFLRQIEKIKKEQQRTDSFTDILRKFQRAVMKVYNNFIKFIAPVLKDLANQFNIAMIPEMLNTFRDQLVELAHDAIPYVKNFFNNLNNPEFESVMTDTFFNMFEYLKVTLRKYFMKGLAGMTPKWLAATLTWLGVYDDLEKLGKAQQKYLDNVKQGAKRMVSPDMKAPPAAEDVNSENRIPVKIGDTTYYVGSNFGRDDRGFFTGLSGPYKADTPATRTRLSAAAQRDAVYAAREALAEQQKLAADDAEAFGGLNRLKREALIEHYRANGGMASRRVSAYSLIAGLSNKEKFKTLTERDIALLQKNLSDPRVEQRMNEMRSKYPNTYLGMNTGTLGRLGSLFGNFGKGTPAQLHGYEAVVTPKQLGEVISASSQISVRDVVNRLNSNINLMISVAKQDLSIERSKFLAMT